MSSPLKVGPQAPCFDEFGLGERMLYFVAKPKPAGILSPAHSFGWQGGEDVKANYP
jgi:hypothetical protein